MSFFLKPEKVFTYTEGGYEFSYVQLRGSQMTRIEQATFKMKGRKGTFDFTGQTLRVLEKGLRGWKRVDPNAEEPPEFCKANIDLIPAETRDVLAGLITGAELDEESEKNSEPQSAESTTPE